MDGSDEDQRSSALKAALGRMTGGTLAVFEYLLAVGTIAALILNMQPESRPLSTLAAVILAAIVSLPLLVAIHFWTEWENRKKADKDSDA